MRGFILGSAFLFWLPTALAQQQSIPSECAKIVDRKGEDFDIGWLKQPIAPDSLTQQVVQEMLEFSLFYNQPSLPDSMKRSILERETRQCEINTQAFLESYQSGDQLWAIHIKPDYSKLESGDFWFESLGYIILNDCQIKKTWITVEIDGSKP